MRTKKAIINMSINMISFLLIFIPNLIVRRVFLNSLGSEMLGLNSLYSNIIGWLSVLELGIGVSIIYSLYKPFAKKEKEKVRAYISFYRKFYLIIGFIILGLGIIMSIYIDRFINDDINIKIARVGFILFLLNSFLTYLFSSNLCILNVAQEGYKIVIGNTISKIIIILIQIVILIKKPNFFLFLSIQLIVNLIYFIIINLYIIKTYPWLRDGNESLEKSEEKELTKNVKAMFMHKIGGLIVNSTDNIIISTFIGLQSLAKYTNYQVIISAFQNVITSGLNGLTSSIGNMLIDCEKSKVYNIHKKIFFINFWIASFSVISLHNTLNQFIVLWVGEKYLIDKLTFYVILINLYFLLMRSSVDQFQIASGNFYKDRYIPLIESIINLISSLILVKYFGIAGVFIGTLMSNFLVIFWTKPYIVYKYVFKINVIEYFKIYFKYLFIAIINLSITSYLSNQYKYIYTLGGFIINCILNILTINIVYIIIFFKNDEFRYYLSLIKNIVNKCRNTYKKERKYE